MSGFAIDIIGLSGFAALMGGLFLLWGAPVALVSGGSLALLYAIVASRGSS